MPKRSSVVLRSVISKINTKYRNNDRKKTIPFPSIDYPEKFPDVVSITFGISSNHHPQKSEIVFQFKHESLIITVL